MLLSSIRYGEISICRADFSFAPSKLLGPTLTIAMYSKAINVLFAL